VSPAIAFATARRVLLQLRGDPRTIALLLVVPSALLVLMRFVFDHDSAVFQRLGVPMLGIFPLVSMFLVTSIAMLRERTTGTLERLMTMPLAKLDILAGYGIAFATMAIVQSGIASAVGFGVLGLDVAGPVWMVVALAVANALLGMSLGLFLSAFASTEFQAVQFMPAFLLPQLLLCGLIASRDSMAKLLRWASDVLPMTYAYDALARVASDPHPGGRVVVDAAVLIAATLLALCLGAATLRRRTG
jgi:ABC-2 type transport system permease protein